MEDVLTVKEVAKILRVNPRAVYGLINSGDLPHLNLGSKKVRRTSLDKFIEEQERQTMENEQVD